MYYKYTYKLFTPETGIGLYVPCYRIYAGSTDENEDYYSVFDVAMTNFDADSIEISE